MLNLLNLIFSLESKRLLLKKRYLEILKNLSNLRRRKNLKKLKRIEKQDRKARAKEKKFFFLIIK